MTDAYVIYGLCDPATGEIRYVGKTSTGAQWRRTRHIWQARSKAANCQRWVSRWIRSLNYKIGVVVLEESPDDPAASEREWIERLRSQGARLTNHTRGGEGVPAGQFKHRAEHIAAMRGRTLPPEWRAAISRGQKGRKLSPEQIERLRAANTGRKATPEARAKMSAAKKGIPKSAETRARMRLASQRRGATLRGIPISAETRAKISATLKGKPKSEEHRQHMRDAWVNRKGVV